jgi:hypothetical protein
MSIQTKARATHDRAVLAALARTCYSAFSQSTRSRLTSSGRSCWTQ